MSLCTIMQFLLWIINEKSLFSLCFHVYRPHLALFSAYYVGNIFHVCDQAKKLFHFGYEPIIWKTLPERD